MERDARAGGPVVRGFGPSGFRLDEDTTYRAVLLTVDTAESWAPPPLAALSLSSVQPLLDARPEFILLGTGAALVHPPVTLTRALEAHGIGLEAMDSRAAARAWGVLRSEGRVIAAALYPLDA